MIDENTSHADLQGLVALKPEDFEDMLERAAHRGAKRALEGVGLHDERAGDDIRDIRALVRDWRMVRGAFLRALGKVLLWGVLIVLAAFGIKTGVISEIKSSVIGGKP